MTAAGPREGLSVTHRRYVPASHAHYGGNLVDGAYVLGLFGDVATELAIRTDGDESLFASYSDVQFLAPVLAGDVIEATAVLVRGRPPQSRARLRGQGRLPRRPRAWAVGLAGARRTPDRRYRDRHDRRSGCGLTGRRYDLAWAERPCQVHRPGRFPAVPPGGGVRPSGPGPSCGSRIIFRHSLVLACHLKLRVTSRLELIARGGECHDCSAGAECGDAEVVGAGGAVAGCAGRGAGCDGAERGAADAGGVVSCVGD